MVKKYIDADLLRKEIERLIKKDNYEIFDVPALLSFIDSLQQEQPEQDITEFEKALNDFGDAYATLVDRDNNPNIGIHCNAYHELVQERVNEILSLAKEYVKREQPEETIDNSLDEEIKRMMVKQPFVIKAKDQIAFARHFAEWQKKQMMKEAVEGEICGRVYDHINVRFADGVCKYLEPKNISHIPADVSKYNIGDKVRIIIVKEEESK